LVVEACQQLAQGNTMSHPSLIYDAQLEKENKIKLIEHMPTILRDMCLKKPDDFMCYRLIRKIFAGTKCLNKKKPSHIYCLNKLLEYKSLSPQTVVRLFHEFEDVLKGGIVPLHPFDYMEEAVNRQEFTTQFSPKLQSLYTQSLLCSRGNKLVHDRLLYQAHMLANPDDIPLLVGNLGWVMESEWKKDYAKIIERTLKDLVTLDTFYTYDAATLKRLTHEFVTTFGSKFMRDAVTKLIAARFTHHCNRICTRNETVRGQLQEQLKNNRAILDALLIESNTDQLTKLQEKKYIDEQLCNELEEHELACSVCLEPFADYMKRAKGSDVGNKYELPCNHPLCSTCYGKLYLALCPLCREPV
jgi:hypothetical protein